MSTAQRKPLPCPDCEEGMREVSRHGGNDPDTWLIRCETCDGSGTAVCDARGCGEEATHAWINVGDPAEAHALLCAKHHAEWLAEQTEEEEAMNRDDALAELVLTAQHAAATFEQYERLHLAKSPPDTEKARRNQIEAAALRAALVPFEKARTDLPQPQRRDGQPPCGECHVQSGETCDICGAVGECGLPLHYGEARTDGE